MDQMEIPAITNLAVWEYPSSVPNFIMADF
jgi:hypothetical protein